MNGDLHRPTRVILVMWEAQFGDFVNGAQPMIDQILAAAESKWRYMNGIVMLLPHGYEGQGPEHSNAYVERFLGLCAENNMQVIIPSTPAQYFHALRRQMIRNFRKPLISMMPKSMLRDPTKSSNIEEFTDAGFQLVIDDPCTIAAKNFDHIRRVVLCTGKVYYTLRDARDTAKDKCNDVAIVRVEQFIRSRKKRWRRSLVDTAGNRKSSGFRMSRRIAAPGHSCSHACVRCCQTRS